ncbi:uncharacterized protein LOC143834288 [Paroedura picta]|uniref:uncharacterized protein LOC143834288 n=1 Tax=Paroedura picta TaxID=143630 RepID=UPI004057907C
MPPKEKEAAKRETSKAEGHMWGFPGQPQLAGPELRGSAVGQKGGQPGCPSEGSPRRLSSHQARGLEPAADLSAGRRRGKPSGRQGGGSGAAACPDCDPRAAPHWQGSPLPGSGAHRPPGNGNGEPALKDTSAPGESEAGPESRSMIFWPLSKLSLFSSAGKASAESPGSPPPQHLKQGKAKPKSNLIPETDESLSKTNPLEVLRNSSHPLSSQFLQAIEGPFQIVNDLLDENQQLQKELSEVKLFQQELQKWRSSKGISAHHLVAENQRLRQELQELKNAQEALLIENQELRLALWKRPEPESETKAKEVPVPQIRAFPVQVQRSGETGGCEKQFVHDVARILNGHQVSLQVQEYQEGLEHLQLLFSPITSRQDADIDNALYGLKSTQKTLLVVFHHQAKSSTKFFADLKSQVQHPALVGTVHAYFSMQDGFYHCQINQDAVEAVAAIIMQHIQDG